MRLYRVSDECNEPLATIWAWSWLEAAEITQGMWLRSELFCVFAYVQEVQC